MFQNPGNREETARPKSSAPRRKEKAAPRKSGPIQPAFPADEYMSAGGPWSKIAAGEMDMGIPPMIQVPNAAVPPMQMQDTRIASNIQEEPSPYPLDYANSTQTKLNPALGTQMLRDFDIGKKPGSKYQQTLESSQKVADSMKNDLYMEPGVYEGLANQIEALPQFQGRKRSMDESEAMRQKMLNGIEVETDLTPLMALSDAWFGGDLAKNYKRPMTQMEKAKEVFAQDKINQDSQNQYLQDLLKTTQFLKSGSKETEAARALAEQMGLVRENLPPPRPLSGNSGRGTALDAWKVIQEGGKISKEVQDNLSALNSAEQMIATGDYGSIKRALAIVARSVSGEKGVLTDQDIARILTNTLQMDAARIQAYMTSNPAVKVDGKIVDSIMQDLRGAKSRIANNGVNKLNAFNGQLITAPGFSGLPTADMLKPQIDAIQKSANASVQTNDEKETENFMKKFEMLKQQKLKGAQGAK